MIFGFCEQVTYVNYSNWLEGIKTSFLIFMKNFDKRNSSNEIKVYILNKNWRKQVSSTSGDVYQWQNFLQQSVISIIKHALETQSLLTITCGRKLFGKHLGSRGSYRVTISQ